MCTQKPPHEYSKELYDKYKETFVTYIKEKVEFDLTCLILVATVKVHATCHQTLQSHQYQHW